MGDKISAGGDSVSKQREGAVRQLIAITSMRLQLAERPSSLSSYGTLQIKRGGSAC